MIALDASVVLDVLIGDERYADASERAIADALSHDEVVVCDAVVAELQTMLDGSHSVLDILGTMGVRYEPTSAQAAERAGHMHSRFRSRGGRRERVVADFLVGAHALLQCNALITRDEVFFRDYFKGLKLIAPKPG